VIRPQMPPYLVAAGSPTAFSCRTVDAEKAFSRRKHPTPSSARKGGEGEADIKAPPLHAAAGPVFPAGGAASRLRRGVSSCCFWRPVGGGDAMCGLGSAAVCSAPKPGQGRFEAPCAVLSSRAFIFFCRRRPSTMRRAPVVFGFSSIVAVRRPEKSADPASAWRWAPYLSGRGLSSIPFSISFAASPAGPPAFIIPLLDLWVRHRRRAEARVIFNRHAFFSKLWWLKWWR